MSTEAIERAKAEGWGDHHAPLVAEFRAWKAERGFTADEGDAEDMMLHPRLTPEEREWLRAFIERWDEAQREHDHSAFVGQPYVEADPANPTPKELEEARLAAAMDGDACVISRTALLQIFTAADDYHDDLISGLEDGTYEDEDGENSDLIARLAVALNEARKALGKS